MPIYEFEGKEPIIHPTVFVAPTATVIGDVTIDEGSSVWPGAVIRGDFNKITIGKFTNIQDNAVVHATPLNFAKIGDHVTVGHGAIVHAAVIMSNTLIGMKAVVLDGTIIHENSIIGAGSVVLENKEIPAMSLVLGIPARVVRTLNDDEKKQLNTRTMRYFRLAQRHKKENYENMKQGKTVNEL